MKTARQNLGRWGESQVADYLHQKGYEILDRNVRTPYGEIDLIASQTTTSQPAEAAERVIVFIEVKTRTTSTFGYPEESVTSRKRSHLLSAAQHYIAEHPQLGDTWRIDVIAVRRFNDRQETDILHFENAVA